MAAVNLGHRHVDPDQLDADGDRAPGPAAVAVVGAAPDPLALLLVCCLVIAVVALNGVLLIFGAGRAAGLGSMQPGFWGFLMVILLTSPLQAAAEEIFFRGYLMQALGSLVARPWFGVVVSALVFALLHGTAEPAAVPGPVGLRAAGGGAGAGGPAGSRPASPRTSSTTSARTCSPGSPPRSPTSEASARSAGSTRRSTSAASRCSPCWRMLFSLAAADPGRSRVGLSGHDRYRFGAIRRPAVKSLLVPRARAHTWRQGRWGIG